jgi:hypothetical protein
VRLVSLLVMGVLSVAVIAEGAYLARTRHRVEALEAQLQQAQEGMPIGRDDGDSPGSSRSGLSGGDEGRPRGPAGGGPARMPLPRFVPAPSAKEVPLPAMLENPESREKLRAFVAAELQRERDEARDQARQRRDEQQQQRLNNMAKALALNEAEARKFTDIFTASQNARQELRQKIEAGQIQRADLGKEFQSLQAKTNEDLKSLLGDDRMKKLQELQRQDRRGGWGGPGGPGGPGGGGPGRGGWGGPGGPPGGGAPPPPPQ